MCNSSEECPSCGVYVWSGDFNEEPNNLICSGVLKKGVEQGKNIIIYLYHCPACECIFITKHDNLTGKRNIELVLRKSNFYGDFEPLIIKKLLACKKENTDTQMWFSYSEFGS